MMKRMKKAISFFMAVCMLAGNSYVNTEADTAVTMSGWTEEVQETSAPTVPEPLVVSSMREVFRPIERLASAEDTPTTSVDGSSFVINHPYNTGKYVGQGEVIELQGDSLVLTINKINSDGVQVPVDAKSVQMTTGNPEVVTINPESGNAFSGTVTRTGPGYAQIQIFITDNEGRTHIRTCYINVDLTVVKTSDEWVKYPENTENSILVLEQPTPYQVELKYVDKKNINGAEVTWDWTNEGVISIDKGVITPLGAGTSTVSITTDTNDEKGNPDITTFEVIVKPEGGTSYDSTGASYDSKVVFNTNASDFSIYSNGNPAVNMDWKIYQVLYDGNKAEYIPISQNDTTLLSYTISDVSGSIDFKDAKAGTYQVVGYASEKYGDRDWNKVVYDFVVNLSIKDTMTYMSVDDVYNVITNSNIPTGTFKDLFSIDFEENSATEGNVVSISENGLVTAKGKGTAKVKVLYKGNTLNKVKSIFAPTDKLNYEKKAVYSFEIIDGLSLNSTLLNLYTGATFQLLANVTDRTVPVVWASSDPSKVKVDQNGLVTAVKPTDQNTPVRVTATQSINGVEKTMVCNVFVQPAVTSVTLDPAQITMEIDEYATIKADVKPADISGTSLKWISSNPSVFEISQEEDLTVVIKALAGGRAVLTAINAENIVVGYCEVTVNQPATGIRLSKTSVVEKFSKGTYQLYATLLPEDTTNGKIIWASQNPKIATVDQNGLVTFKNAGTVTISAQSEDNPMLIAYCHFTIEKTVSGVKLDQHAIELYAGESKRLTYTITPANVSNADVTWTSFDTSVAAVDKTGMVTAKGPGSTQIMIMTEEGSYYDLCTVTVEQYATGVRMNYTNVVMNRGDYFDMEVTVTPANCTDRSLVWESLNPKIVTVSSTGRITAKSVGNAIVMVKTLNGVVSYCEIEVLEPVTSLSLDEESIIIDVGETFTLTPVFTPAAPSNQEVLWTVSDSSIAEINPLGEITGLTGGTIVVTCESVDGGYKAFCLVTVEEPVIEITVTPETYRLGLGKSYQLTATISNHGTATEDEIIWSSSDESICTVNQHGKITGVDYGYATIKAEAADGYGAYAVCEVRVVREVTSIKLNYTFLQVVQGETVSLRADIQPSNATYNEADFVSDDTTIAIVDEEGLITGITPGETWIHANAQDNSGKTASCFVKVIAPIAATGVTVSDKEIVLIPGESKDIVASIRPSTSTDELIWTSGNEYIATVDGNGTITARTTGTTTVTVMTSSGKTATVNVIVLGLSRTNLSIPIYTKYSTLVVDGATTSVRWDVQDTSICEVRNGVITARKAGTTYVTATVNGRTLKCKVTVTSNKKK